MARFSLAIIVVLHGAHLLNGQTTQPASIEASGIRVTVPSGWMANRELLAAGGPISITNFRGAYDRGGIVPPSGAEMELTSGPNPRNLAQFIQTELKGTNYEKLQEVSENGKTGIRASYVEVLAKDVSLTNVV